MKRLSLEFSRLFREPFTWLILFLTLLSPAVGLFGISPYPRIPPSPYIWQTLLWPEELPEAFSSEF